MLRLDFRPDSLHRVATDDGAQIALARYLPRGERRFAEPVILAHGLGANRFTWDFSPRHSLARRLAERGFDAWILELRGRGEAGPARRINFDLQAEHDVASALRCVLSTGAKRVSWVGHSKGAMVALAHLARNPAAPISAIATLGAPLSFAGHQGLESFARFARPAMVVPTIPISFLAKLALVVPPPNWFMRYLIHGENLEPDVRRRALFNVGADVSAGVAKQFLDWISTGRWTTAGGGFDYQKGLEAMRMPVLMIAGTRDLLAPPDSMAPVLANWAGPHELVLADYGHGDLVLGRDAPDELYPRVVDFLEAHSTLQSRT
jgi:pimeloyl-ACP methyl ester carboxylesterase